MGCGEISLRFAGTSHSRPLDEILNSKNLLTLKI